MNQALDIDKNEDTKNSSSSRKQEKVVCFGCQELLSTERVGVCVSGSRTSVADGDNSSSGGGNKMKMNCPRCRNVFCVECDIFIHDSLHNCPGCYVLE
jgi:transcription factor Ssl1